MHPRESYNDVIERLIHVKKDTGELSEQTLRDIEQSLKEIGGGKNPHFGGGRKEIRDRMNYRDCVFRPCRQPIKAVEQGHTN